MRSIIRIAASRIRGALRLTLAALSAAVVFGAVFSAGAFAAHPTRSDVLDRLSDGQARFDSAPPEGHVSPAAAVVPAPAQSAMGYANINAWTAGGTDIALDSVGYAYVAAGGSVTRRGLTGLQVGEPLGSSGAGRLSAANGVAVGPDDSVYVTDAAAIARVAVFDRNGAYVRSFGEGALVAPTGINVGPDGSVFVTDAANKNVTKFKADGTVAWAAALRSGLGTATPSDCAYFPKSDSLLVASQYNYLNPLVFVYNASTGAFKGVWGQGCYYLSGIAVDKDGNVFVSDFWDKKIKRLDSSGTGAVVEVLGSGYTYPMGVACLGGDVFALDSAAGGNRVYWFHPSLSTADFTVGLDPPSMVLLPRGTRAQRMTFGLAENVTRPARFQMVSLPSAVTYRLTPQSTAETLSISADRTAEVAYAAARGYRGPADIRTAVISASQIVLSDTSLRTTDVSGDEVVVPFIPEREGDGAVVEEGGTLRRYYRVVDAGFDPKEPAGLVGVMSGEGTATVRVTSNGAERSAEATRLVMDPGWPAGVFAIPVAGLGSSSSTFTVSIDELVIDRHDSLDQSSCTGFSGFVRPRSGSEQQWSYGEKSVVGGTVADVDLEGSAAYSAAYTLKPDDSVRVDVDSTAGLGAGLSVPCGSSIGFTTPVVQGEVAATAGAKVSRSFTTGTSSEFDDPETEGRQGMALAANICDMLRLSQVGSGPQRAATPALAVIGGVLSQTSKARDFQSRRMNGTGCTVASEARVGGSFGFDPKMVDKRVGARIDAGQLAGSYSIEAQLAEYPLRSDGAELGFRLLDNTEGSAALMSIQNENPWLPFGADSDGLAGVLAGKTQIEGVFPASVKQDPPLSIRDAASLLKRIEVTVEDPDANREYVFVTDGAAISKILTDNECNGRTLNEATLVRALQGSVMSAGSEETATVPQWTGIAGPIAEKLVEHATETRVVAGPDAVELTMPWGIQGNLFEIAGLNLGFEQTFLQRSRTLASRGTVRDNILYPVETHEASLEQPRIEELWHSMSGALAKGLADSGETFRNRVIEVVDGAGAFIEQHAPSFGPMPTAPVATAIGSTALPGASSPAAGTVEIEIPAGAFSTPTTVTVDSYPASLTAEAYAPGGQPVYGGIAVLDAVHSVAPLDLSIPATVSIGWSEETANGLDPEVIDLWRFDESTGRWVALDATLGASGTCASVRTVRLGTIAAGADVLGPRIAVSSPLDGACIASVQPWLFFSATDAASGLETATVTAQVDGVDVPVTFDPALGWFSGQLPVLGSGDHQVVVGADDGRGNHTSSSSRFVVDLLAPGAPSGVSVAPSDDAVRVSWSPSSDAAAAYRVYRRAAEQTEAVCIAVCAGTAFADYAVPGGVDCDYSVSAIDAAGNESARVSASTLHLVRTPAITLRATRTDGAVSMSANLTGAGGLPLQGEHYELESSTDGTNWRALGTVEQGVSAFATSTPPPDTTTTYRVVYGGCAGYTSASASAVVTIEGVAPQPPTASPIAVALGTPRVSGKASVRKGTLLKGGMAPPRVTRLLVEVQVLNKRKFKTYRRYNVWTTSTGRWAYKAKLKRGTYRIRAVTIREGAYEPATSGWRRVKVR